MRRGREWLALKIAPWLERPSFEHTLTTTYDNNLPIVANAWPDVKIRVAPRQEGTTR